MVIMMRWVKVCGVVRDDGCPRSQSASIRFYVLYAKHTCAESVQLDCPFIRDAIALIIRPNPS